MEQTAYTSARQQPASIPTSDVAATPPPELTLQEQLRYMQLSEKVACGATLSDQDEADLRRISDKMERRHDYEQAQYEAKKRAKAEREAAARRADMEYRQLLNAPAHTDKSSREYFERQLQERYRLPQGIALGSSQDAILGYLTSAYQRMVATTGRTAALDQPTKHILTSCARWLDTMPKPGLLLRGNVGVGKTTLLKAIAAVIQIRTQQACPIWDAARIAKLGKGPEGQSVLDKLCRQPLLGIDDLGTEPLSVKDYGNDVMPIVELLTERYNKRLFTIITTNLTVVTREGHKQDEIEARYGERIADRLRELCNTLSYDGNQKSYRQ